MTAEQPTDLTAPEQDLAASAKVATPVSNDSKTLKLPGAGPWTFVAGLVGMTALVACGMLWQKVGTMQEQLARQTHDAHAQSLEARALAKQAVDVAQDAAARTLVFDTRLSEVALQRTQLDELMQSLSRSRDENLVVDIEAALRLAQQQAQLTGSVEPLLASLKSAEQRVARAAQPRLALLQRALAHDIDRVKSAAVSDTPTMLIKLDELVRLADGLPLVNDVRSPVAGKPLPPTQNPVAQSWWHRPVQLVVNEAKNLVRVRKVANPESALLSPEQSFFVRENLKLKLLNARLGLLSRQIDAARADLGVAQDTLNKYFDVSARPTQTATALLQQLQQQMRNLQLPRVDETLTVLATAAAGR